MSAKPLETPRQMLGDTPPTPWLRYLLLGATALLMLYPLIWLIGASFKSNAEIFSSAAFCPSRFDLTAYPKRWNTSTEYTYDTNYPKQTK